MTGYRDSVMSVENNTSGNTERWSSQRKAAKIMEEQAEGVERPVTVVAGHIADHISRRPTITVEAFV